MHPSSRSRNLAIATLTLIAMCAMCAGSAAASPGVAGAPVHRPDAGIWRFEKTVPPSVADIGADTPAVMRDWSFEPNARVHPQEGGEHIWPDIAMAEDGTVGVAWMDDHAAGGYHIFYTFSTDGGLTWAPPERVDDRAAGAYSKFVTLAFTPSGTAVAVWEDDRSGQINLYFSKRTGSPGTPWAPALRINTAGGPPSGGDFMNASLAVLDEQRYFVAWTDWREGVFYQVYCRCTRDGGVTWGLERRVSDEIGYQPVAGDPCLVVDPTDPAPGAEVLYCVTNDWRGNVPGGRYPNAFFYRSLDGGSTWSVGVMVNDIDPLYQQVSSHALVRLDDGALAAGWMNNPNSGLTHFRVSRSTNQGASWGASVQVDEASPGGTGVYSAIATDGAYLYAAFDLYSTSWDAYFRASPNGGAQWPDASVRMDDNVTGAATGSPVLAAPHPIIVPPTRSLDVYAAWQDNRSPGYNWKIYATHASLSGQGVPESGIPASMATLRVVPNPSHASAAVVLFSTAPAAPSRVAIFDAAGRAVCRLDLASGGTVWDGRDAFGRFVPAGCYWIRPWAADRPSAGAPLVRLR
jgi:hypothetical protein